MSQTPATLGGCLTAGRTMSTTSGGGCTTHLFATTMAQAASAVGTVRHLLCMNAFCSVHLETWMCGLGRLLVWDMFRRFAALYPPTQLGWSRRMTTPMRWRAVTAALFALLLAPAAYAQTKASMPTISSINFKTGVITFSQGACGGNALFEYRYGISALSGLNHGVSGSRKFASKARSRRRTGS